VRKGAHVAVLDPRQVFLPFEFEHLAIAPGGLEAALGVLVKGAVSGNQVPDKEPVGKYYESLPGQYAGDPVMAERLAALAGILQKSQSPVIVCGTDIVRETTPSVAADLALLMQAAGKDAGLFYLLPGANAFGAALMAAPDRTEAADGQEARWPWGAAGQGEPLGPGQPALSGAQIMEAINQGEIKALVLVENDPFWPAHDEEQVASALERLEFLVVLDYLPSPAAARAHVLLPTIPVFERTESCFVNQEGRAQSAPPVHFGGTPIAQISPDVHPPRIFLDYVPGSDPRTPAEIFQELTQAAAKFPALAPVDLWAWLGRRNPLFNRVGAIFENSEGMRLVPEAASEQDFATPVEPPETPPSDTVELLLVDWTFGTEELSAYSEVIRQVETAPILSMHPKDTETFGLHDGDKIAIRFPKGSFAVQVRVTNNMAPGVAVLPRHRQLDWRKISETPVYLSPQHMEKLQE
jgi:NADH-quinone oxidoreductase subunit G